MVVNPNIEKLFAPTTLNNLVVRGNLISFEYLAWKHDPKPLIIVAEIIPGFRIRGINLHYLTFNYIKNLIQMGTNNPNFSYGNVRSDKYITSAFRTYKWQGIRQVKKLDSQTLLRMIGAVRSFNPNEIEMMRQTIQNQINTELGVSANTIGANGVTNG